jgi:hypothetical protein
LAQRIQTLLIDDLDGGEAAGTVRFGLDGTEYEILIIGSSVRSEPRDYLSKPSPVVGRYVVESVLSYSANTAPAQLRLIAPAG